MTTKHTPGPWGAALEDRLLCDGIKISGPDGRRIAYVHPDDTIEIEGGRIIECCSATQKANARLIAAAPLLLETAKQAVDAIEWLYSLLDDAVAYMPADQALDALRAAIAKAEVS